MAELIDKWEVVNKLIQIQNQYNFYKNVWDADVLYRRIVELEIGIGKTPGMELVRCKDCKHMKIDRNGYRWCLVWTGINGMGDEGFCNYGERKDNG